MHLAELTVDPQGALAIRQLASVLLKQYVEAHWAQMSEKFRPPETSDTVSINNHYCDIRVPTRPGKPGKMRVHLENLEISWNFENFNKYHGKIIKTCKNFLATKNLPLTQILRTQFTMQDYF